MLRGSRACTSRCVRRSSRGPARASGCADLRYLGRHQLHHRIAEVGRLHVRARAGGSPQVYSGSISKFGLDVGATSGGVMVWAVFTDSIAPPGPAFLAGDYFGASGQVTVAAGLGANVLIGGSNNTIALQPVSVSTSVGLNLALGVAELRPGP